jgi:hypothetical protein
MNKKYTSLRRHSSELERIQRSESSSSHEGPLEFFHDTFGNQGVGKLVDHLQLKNIFPSGPDLYEQEADRLAARMVDPSSETLQLKSVSSPSPSVDHSALVNDKIQQFKSGGAALEQGTRSYFEGKMGVDLSQVRVHKDQSTARFAQSINARAFTLGNHIGFGSGQFNPQSRQGKELLAHELVHVVQQGKAGQKSLDRKRHRRHNQKPPVNNRPNVILFKQKMTEIALESVEKNSQHINQLEARYQSYFRMPGAVQQSTGIFSKLREAIEKDQELIAAQKKLVSRIGRIQSQKRILARRGGYRRRERLDELNAERDNIIEQKNELQNVRNMLRMVYPALSFVESENTDLEKDSNYTLFAGMQERIENARTAQAEVKKRLEEGDIPLHKLDAVVSATAQHFGFGETASPEFEKDVNDWMQAEHTRDSVIAIGSAIVSIALAAACFIPGIGVGAIIALGAMGAAVGGASAIYEFEQADDLNEVAKSQDGGIYQLLSDPDAAKEEYIWGIVNLALAGVDAFLAGFEVFKVGKAVSNFSDAATGFRVLNQMGRMDDAVRIVSKLSKVQDSAMFLSKLETASTEAISSISKVLGGATGDMLSSTVRNLGKFDNLDNVGLAVGKFNNPQDAIRYLAEFTDSDIAKLSSGSRTGLTGNQRAFLDGLPHPPEGYRWRNHGDNLLIVNKSGNQGDILRYDPEFNDFITKHDEWRRAAQYAKEGDVLNPNKLDDFPYGSKPCFPAGTLVKTIKGETPIESISVGEKVYAYDEDLGETVESTVEEIYRNWTDTLYTINTKMDAVQATKNHRFWIEGDQDWLDAKDITKGMSVRMLDGSIQKVIDIHCEEVVCDTFNFSVVKQHNYYVGKKGILVHNDSKFAVVDKFASAVYSIVYNGEVVYVGQTIQNQGDYMARIADHIQDGRFDDIFQAEGLSKSIDDIDWFLDEIIDVRPMDLKNGLAKMDLTPFELSVWEQYYINMYGGSDGLPRYNKIRAITEEKYMNYWQYHNPC